MSRSAHPGLAEGVLINVRDAIDSMFYQDRAIIDMVDAFHLDGVVYHPVRAAAPLPRAWPTTDAH
jgi:hypothetical protein